MSGGLFGAMFGSMFAPRRGARRILAARPSPGDVMAIVLFTAIATMATQRFFEMQAGVSFAQRMIDILAPAFDDLADAVVSAEEAAVYRERAEALRELRPNVTPPFGPPQIAVAVIWYALCYGLTVAAGWGLPRLAGGVASTSDVATVTAWFLLVMTPLTVVWQMLFFFTPSAGVASFTFILFYAAFVYAAFLSEAHGFRTTWPTFAVLAGAIVLVSSLLQIG